MSFLFDKKTQSALKGIWTIVAILIIVSMIFVFSGGAELLG